MSPSLTSYYRKLTRMACLPLLLCLGLMFASVDSRAENQALKLDGQGSYAELPPNLGGNLTQATVEVWAKWDALQTFSRVFEFGQSWQSISVFNHQNTSDLRYNIYPRNAKRDETVRHIVQVPGLIRTNEWIHLAAVSGPGGMLIYANGRLVGQHTNTASFAALNGSPTNYLGLGLSGNATDQTFLGELDEVRVWNHRRSIAQIREGMFKRLSGREPGLVHLWNFDDGTANDSTTNAAHGKFVGNASVGPSDLGLVAEPVIPVAAATPLPASPAPPAAAPVQVADSSTGMVAWWIAGALSVVALVLVWLTLMLRHSGVGTHKILAPAAPVALPAASPLPAPSLGPADHDQLKERALSELTSFAKESLVQGLFSQRAALLEAQKRAHEEMAELEARLATLQLPERIKAYEQRIAELEREKKSHGEEVQQLTRTTLALLRKKLDEEKQKEQPAHRYN